MVLYSDSDSSYGLLVMYTTCYPDRHHHLFSHSIHTGLDEEKKNNSFEKLEHYMLTHHK